MKVGDFVGDFELRFASLFVEPQYANAFILGLAFAIATVVVLMGLALVLDMLIDLIRCKLGLPVARYVRWVKQQDDIDR